MARLTHVASTQRRVLVALAKILPEDAYLAGGVAVAVWIDHRTSRDLDLFVSSSDPRALIHQLTQLDGVMLVSQAKGTLHLEFDGMPVSILSYPYQHLSPPRPRAGLAMPTASTEDLKVKRSCSRTPGVRWLVSCRSRRP